MKKKTLKLIDWLAEQERTKSLKIIYKIPQEKKIKISRYENDVLNGKAL